MSTIVLLTWCCQQMFPLLWLCSYDVNSASLCKLFLGCLLLNLSYFSEEKIHLPWQPLRLQIFCKRNLMVKLSNFEILHPDKNSISFEFSINIDQTKNETIIVIGHFLGAPSLLADATVHKQTKINWLADFIGKLWCNSLKTGEIKKNLS